MKSRLEINLSKKWAILSDDEQWILASVEKLTDAARHKKRQARFKAVGYVGHRKTTLLRLALEYSAPITQETLAILDTWPETFREWQKLNKIVWQAA